MLSESELTGIILSEITTLEFFSAVFKRVRIKDISMEDAKQIIALYENDINKYQFVPLSKTILNTAKGLNTKHGTAGLRTLDAVQLASAMEVKGAVNKYFTSDRLLQLLFEKEGLLTH